MTNTNAPSLPSQGGISPTAVAPPQNSVPSASVSPLAESLAAEALRATTGGSTNPLGMARPPAPFEGIVNPAATGESAPIRRRVEGILPLWETEKQAIEDAIESCGGNIPKAAALLGISASTIYRKRQHWETLEAKD